jgi:N-acetylmuramoyl-L-alanine amidase
MDFGGAPALGLLQCVIAMGIRRAALWALLLLATPVAGAEFPTVKHDGRSYVELARIATSLGTKVDATRVSARAHLRPPGHVVTLTRNWSQVVVDGRPIVLDGRVLVKRGAWLVPETFVARVLPALAPPGPAALPATAASPAATRASSRGTATLEDLRVRSYPSFTRVVVETSGPIDHRVEAHGPREARVRLGSLVSEARVERVGDGFVESLTLDRAGADAILRIAFEGAAGEIRVTTLADPPRLVLDLLRPDAGATRERPGLGAPLRVVVLDAGHGGHDSGAVGPSGLMEKELVLEVTRRVAKLAEQRLAMKVLLSRDGDYFVPLRDRTSFANRERADLFVSIHANAHREVASEGVETYFLSSEATDNEARQVAALENDVVQLERPAARGRSDVVKSILWDLAQSEFQLESSRLAEIVLDSMTNSLRIPNRGVKQAGFYVLGGAAMPAVLIEIGFVTNPKEERKLRDLRYRDEIARAIFGGIAEYKRYWDQRMRTALDRQR